MSVIVKTTVISHGGAYVTFYTLIEEDVFPKICFFEADRDESKSQEITLVICFPALRAPAGHSFGLAINH